MSAIFGILNFDGKPVTKQDLEKMKAPIQYWGPDGEGLWCEGSVGLGHLLLYNTPESVHEKLPMVSPCGNFVLTAAARIDNRKELSDILDINFHDPSIPDSWYIMKAYMKWGEDCPKRLYGDWSFAIWDKRKKALFLSRDHCGITSVYLIFNSSFVAFSSSKKSLLSIFPQQKLNDRVISKHLLGANQFGSQTFYQNIDKLLPTNSMIFAINGRLKRVYHNAFLNAKSILYKNDIDYITHLDELYKKAVKSRIRSYRDVITTLSGGLDSASVNLYYSKVSKDRIKAIISVPLYQSSANLPKFFPDELSLAKLISNKLENITLITDNSSEINPIEGIDMAIKVFDEPVKNPSNSYWIHSMYKKISELGGGTLLIGARGNNTISWPSANKISSGYKLIDRFKYYYRTNKSLFSKAFKIANFRNNNYYNPYMNVSFTNTISNRIVLELELQKLKYINDSRMLMLNSDASVACSMYNETGAFHGINIADPTGDIDIVRFCLSIPIFQFTLTGNRSIMKRLLQNQIPNEVIENQRIGLQAPDLVERTKIALSNYSNSENQNMLSSKYIASKNIDHGIISAANGNMSHTEVILLLRTIALNKWLVSI